MGQVFLSSDLHISHDNILTFRGNDGELIRGQFSSVEEMNEHIVERHNAVVGPEDTWYCLGDVGFGMKDVDAVLGRLNGKKRLILGNHDYPRKGDFETYFKHFKKVMESRRFGPIVLTHRPIRMDSEIRVRANVHGHIHEKVIDDPRYLNVSVEAIDYTPVSIDWIVEQYAERGVDLGDTPVT